MASPYRRNRRPPREVDRTRLNDRIRAREVRVVGEGGEQLGILDTRDALERARETGLDLVEVAPNAEPPVCKIMDYGKFKYQQQKKQQEAKKKQTVIQIKEIKVRPKTDEHDYQTKLKHIRRFLAGGDRCKVTVFFRGREIVHKDRGLRMLERVIVDTDDIAKVEQHPQAEGRTMHMMLTPTAKKESPAAASERKANEEAAAATKTAKSGDAPGKTNAPPESEELTLATEPIVETGDTSDSGGTGDATDSVETGDAGVPETIEKAPAADAAGEE